MASDARSDASVCILKGRFEILLDSPLPLSNAARVSAFAARDLQDTDDEIFALVCDAELPQRSEILERLQKMPGADLVQLLDYGISSWMRGEGCRFILIFERPSGKRVASDISSLPAPMSEAKVIKEVLEPVTGTLSRLSDRGITHRAIRPTNMFFRGDGEGDGEKGVILGECASVPPGLDQPPAFETIESLLSDPYGRGPGKLSDDLYALGVTILALTTGEDPAAGRGAAKLLAEKMTRGSYHTLVGGHLLPESLCDVLHGLLEDRPDARWDIDDLEAWFEDRETRPARAAQQPKPERGFSFGGRIFHDPRALAIAMAADWEKAVFKENGHEILTWARKSLGDDEIANRLLAAIELSKRDQHTGKGEESKAALVARLCMALDNKAPVRYKNVSAHIDGLGPIFAACVSDHQVVRELSEVFSHELPGCHIRMVHGTKGNGPAMARGFSLYAHFIKAGGIGGGLERCLYELNPAQYCRSPLIADQKVMQVGDLLPALERAAKRSHRGPPMDRHIAAFIAARCEGNIEEFLRALNKSDNREEAVLGLLGLLATVAAQTGAKYFPGLADWLSHHVSPAVECYHHQAWRAKAKAELPAILDSGDLGRIYRFLANGEARQRDREGYATAVARCRVIDQQIQFLGSAQAKDPIKAMDYGHGLSVLFSAVISFGAIAATLALVL